MTHHQNKLNWIRLSRTKNIGPITCLSLLKIFGNTQNIIDNVEEYYLNKNLKKQIKLHPVDLAIKELENCHKIGAEIITFDDQKYPALLKEISDPPLILTARGNASLLSEKIIAIVGPRNASVNGCKFANQIARQLGESNLITSSGMARGIDTAAHYGSLSTGTIAVIAGGIDNIYPKENTKLYHQIIESGVVISENQFGSSPCAANFPRRNRIISGLSLGAVIIEATLRSGTLITARCALEQNREVFAVPGSPFDPRHQGTNKLIKQGAKLLENVNDILEELDQVKIDSNTSHRASNSTANKNQGFSQYTSIPKDEKYHKEAVSNSETISFNSADQEINQTIKLILTKINSTPTPINDIIAELKIPTKIANIALIQMEMSGKIENKNGKIALSF